jgi:hypothetical protein
LPELAESRSLLLVLLVLLVLLAHVTGIVLSVLLPAEPLLWEWFQHSTLVSSWRRYFQFSIAVEQKLDERGKYIFAGGWLACGWLAPEPVRLGNSSARLERYAYRVSSLFKGCCQNRCWCCSTWVGFFSGSCREQQATAAGGHGCLFVMHNSASVFTTAGFTAGSVGR